MTRRRYLLVVIAVVLIAIGVFSSENVTRLDFTSWGRDMWQRPADVVAALDIERGQRVADLGAGKGYFIPHLKDAAGPGGVVFAVEVEADKTAALEKRFSDASVQVVLGDYGDPKLPDRSVDLVLLVNTYHHIEDRTAYFAKLKSDLAPGGRVAIVELDRELSGLLALFFPEDHASTLANVREEMRAAGYRERKLHDFLPIQFVVEFVPE